jgi:hypothetical protein
MGRRFLELLPIRCLRNACSVQGVDHKHALEVPEWQAVAEPPPFANRPERASFGRLCP